MTGDSDAELAEGGAQDSRLSNLPVLAYIITFCFGNVLLIGSADTTSLSGVLWMVVKVILFSTSISAVSGFLILWLQPNLKKAIHVDIEESPMEHFVRLMWPAMALSFVIFLWTVPPADEVNRVAWTSGAFVVASVIWSVLYIAPRQPYFEDGGGVNGA